MTKKKPIREGEAFAGILQETGYSNRVQGIKYGGKGSYALVEEVFLGGGGVVGGGGGGGGGGVFGGGAETTSRDHQ